MAKDQETREKFMELRARGISYEKIAARINVSKPTLIKWSQKYAFQIAKLRDHELQMMCERFRLSQVARLERFAKQLDRMEETLSNRDLTDVQTDRLMRLYMQMLESVRREVEPERLEVSADVAVADPLARWAEIVREVAVAVEGADKLVVTPGP